MQKKEILLFLWAGFLGALLSAACGRSGKNGSLSAPPLPSRSLSAIPFPVFLLPSAKVPLAGRAFSLDPAAGTALPGRPVTWKDLRVDCLFARQGGRQWVLVPGRGAEIPLPGEVLLGLLSRPAAVPGVRGKVVYCSKTLWQVSHSPEGVSRAAPSSVTAEAGLPLEIVPLADPAGLRPGDDCPIQTVFRGDPLAGAEIRVEGECRGWGNPILLKTGPEGGACFRLEGAGSWLITVCRVDVSSLEEPITWVSSLLFEVKGGKR